MAGTIIGGAWDSDRLEALQKTLRMALNGDQDETELSAEMQMSVEWLRPLWDEYVRDEVRREIVRLYVESYAFPHTKAMYAAMKDTGIDMDVVSAVTPDKRSMSVQLLVEAGFYGEGYALMEKRCQTLKSKRLGLHEYFERRALEAEEDGDW